MAKSGTKKMRDEKRQVRDLAVKPTRDAGVKGGKASPVLLKACATGEHIREATITI